MAKTGGFRSLEELEDEFFGPKGTPKREKYEAEVEKYRRKIIKKHMVSVPSNTSLTPDSSNYRGEKEVDYV